MTDTNDTLKTDDTAIDSSSPDTDSASEVSDLTGKNFPEPAAVQASAKDLDDEDEEEGETKPLEEDNPTPAETFEELELSPVLMEAIHKLNWTKPTLIQGLCLPLTTQGQDVAGFSQTGTGKTGVFLITVAHQILKMREAGGGETSKDPKAIVLAPTRELAVQISSDAEQLFNQIGVSCMAVYGGVDYDKQAQQIRSGIDVIVATPGRLKDYFQKRIFSMKDCSLFICDEADRMFDMGFIDDVEYFLEKLSPETQKLLFSATTNEKVKELAFEYLESPKYISANPEVMTPEKITQHAVIAESHQKLQVMLGLFREHNPAVAIIFVNTKVVAEWLQYKLKGNGIEVDLITGDLPQRKRISLIQRIKNDEVKALIATDVASRGLHISGITHVYNFDLPDEAANYVHRIGRTARAGASGAAYSLVCEDYGHNLLTIQRYLGENIPIHTGWFPESYLAIEDAAGNPYKDPEFKGNRMKDAEERTRGQRSGSSPRGDKDGRRDRPGRGKDGRSREKKADGPNEVRADGEQVQNQKAGASARGGNQQRPAKQGGPGQGASQRGERRPHKKAHTGGDEPLAAAAGQSQQGGRGRGRQDQNQNQRRNDGDRKLKVIAPQGHVIKPVAAIKKNNEVPNSFFGLIKRLFSVFFKPKK